MIAPYIALVAALAVGIYALVKAYNADADAAKKAEEVSNDLADAAQEAADKLNNIKSAIDGYDSAIDKLNQCTKGTEEWNEALAAVHEQIDSIITKFPELLKEADLFNDDGTLNGDVLDRAIAKAEESKQAADAAALYGQVDAAEARLKSDTTNTARRYE
ncbi:MAG: hypothetical protein NC218_07515 [Acetobacter sp.]|nr:hypothetical protein [Acetobacter sp.]